KTRHKSKFKHIDNVLQCGKAHSHHNSINNSVEGFVEVFISIEDESQKNELTEFFYQSHLKKGADELTHDIICPCREEEINGHGNKQRYGCTKTAIEKTEQKQIQRLALMMVFQINENTDCNTGCKSNGE